MKKEFILLVEDNPDDEALTLRALKKNNFSNPIVVARDGAETIGLLFGRGEHADKHRTDLPVLVMLDLDLPKMNGFEVLKEIRSEERTRLLPVAVLTCSKEQRDVVESYRLGANSYVRKPVDFSEFIQAVRQLGLYWLVLNEPSPR